MVQPNEVVSLLMALALTPLMFATVRHLSFAGKPAFAVGTVLLIVSYVATVLEGFALPDFLNLFEHVALAGTGVAFAVGLLQLRAAERRAER